LSLDHKSLNYEASVRYRGVSRLRFLLEQMRQG
jgi:hypothetical protein